MTAGLTASLAALPKQHMYRRAAEGSYRPEEATDDAAWQAALPLLVEILSADIDAHEGDQDPTSGSWRVWAMWLSRYLYWLAQHQPNALDLFRALDPDRWITFIAELAATQLSDNSVDTADRALAHFRRCHEDLLPPEPVVASRERLDLAKPVPDRTFDRIWSGCDALNGDNAPARTRNALALARAAGLDTGDQRYVNGPAIQDRGPAGWWVVVSGGERPREVPLLARFAPFFADAAVRAGPRCLIADVEPPCNRCQASNLMHSLNVRLSARRFKSQVSVERLRKTWLIEQVENNAPLKPLMRAAGLTSLTTIDSLVWGYAADIADEEVVAWGLGGIGSES